MALADILRALETEAEVEIAHLREQSDATVAQIHAEAEADAQAIRERHRRDVLLPLQEESARRLNRARLAALRATSGARERLFAEALVCARERLARLRTDPCYPVILQALVAEALEQLDSAIVMRADPRDEKILCELLPEVQLQFDLSTWGGIEVREVDGQITITNTLEARLAQSEERLRQEAMPLFEQERLDTDRTSLAAVAEEERHVPS